MGSLLAASACTGHSSAPDAHSSSPAQRLGSGGTVTIAEDEGLSGFNPDVSSAAELTQEVMNLVWPSPYVLTPQLTLTMNAALLSSAHSSTSGATQVVTYHLNPMARWADGTPITADDFIYNWQAQSSNPSYTDVDGQAYNSGAGLASVSSVKGSNPASGRCRPGSVADRDEGLCPNGETVTVTHRMPDATWQSDFANLVPAHVARRVGWNTGFNDWHNVLSGGPYRISSYAPRRAIVLSRNPSYWARPAGVGSISFRFFGSDQAEADALRAGAVNIIEPASPSVPIVQATNDLPGVTTKDMQSLEYEHIDFNEANYYLANRQVRRAIAFATDRPDIIRHTVGQLDPNIAPLGNDFSLPGEKPYVDDGRRFDHVNDAKARSLLAGLGYREVRGHVEPQAGPLAHQPLTFAITSTTGNPTRLTSERLFRAELKRVGIKIEIKNQPATRLFDATLPGGDYDIAEFAWIATPSLSSGRSSFCSYTDATACSQNWVHYANPKVDRLMARGDASRRLARSVRDYHHADRILWREMVTLPLYQSPQYYAWSSRIANVEPNASTAGLTWNAQTWTLRPTPST